MSGLSRTSVSTIPNTGKVITVTGVTGETTTLTGTNLDGVWKIIGVSITNASLADGTALLIITDSAGVNVKLSVSTTISAGSTTPIKISEYTAGDLLVDNKLKLAVLIGGDNNLDVNVAYFLVN